MSVRYNHSLRPMSFLRSLFSRRHSPVSRSRQAGLTLIEGLLSVGIVASGLAIITTLQVSQFNYEKAAVTAQQHRIVHYAARRYLRDNFGAVLAEVSRGGVTEIPPSLLAAEGYVPDFMVQNGVLRPNPYDQSYRLLVRRTDGEKPPPTLELLTVTSGGKELSASEVGRIMSIAGAEAGGMSIDGTHLNGAYGSWEIPLREFPPEYRIGRGNLAMIAYYRQGGGVYVNSYAVNIPSRRDEYEELPTTEDRLAGSQGRGVSSIIQRQRQRSQEIRDRNRTVNDPAERSVSGILGRSYDIDQLPRRSNSSFFFFDDDAGGSSAQTFAPPPAPQAAPQPPPVPVQAAAAPKPVQSDNTSAVAGAKCAPERSLAISLDNTNQILVCQDKVWQPIALPLALHYAGLAKNEAIVNSQQFGLNQRGYLIADAAIGPVRGEERISLPPAAGIKVNGRDCVNAAPDSNGVLDGQYRCVMVLDPGQYIVSSTDGIGSAQRAYHRLSFVVLPY